MDHVLAHEAANVLALTVENGGCTFEGKTLLVHTWDSGFAVGLGGVALPEAQATPEAIAWLARRVSGEFMTTYCGTWLKDGIVHLDAVRYFAPENYLGALAAGEEAGQQAIYDFAARKDITL